MGSRRLATGGPVMMQRRMGRDALSDRRRPALRRRAAALEFVVPVAITVLAFYLTFMVFPIVYTFYGSFFDWRPFQGRFEFQGWSHYRDLLSDPSFYRGMRINLTFTVGVVIGRTALGLAIALAIASLRFGAQLFRTVYFLPVVAPMISVALLWTWIYDPNYGLANQALGLVGLPDLRWLKDPDLALVGIMLMTVWKEVGYAVVIYLAALAGVPRSLYEAATIDGANAWNRFVHVTLPSIRPATAFVVVTSIITYLQTFGQIYIMTKGGPGTSTTTTVYQIYDEAFVLFDFGTAAALSMLLFVVVGIVTVVNFRFVAGRGA